MSSEAPVISGTSETQAAPSSSAPVKEKKPRTEAQKAATQKALAAMTAKRKEINEQIKEKKEKVKVAKKVVAEKILKEDLGFVSHRDFDDRVSSLTKEVAELRGMLTMKQQAPVEKPAAAAPKERIVERVIERVPTPSAQPQKLSGHALLDSIFFNK